MDGKGVRTFPVRLPAPQTWKAKFTSGGLPLACCVTSYSKLTSITMCSLEETSEDLQKVEQLCSQGTRGGVGGYTGRMLGNILGETVKGGWQYRTDKDLIFKGHAN